MAKSKKSLPTPFGKLFNLKSYYHPRANGFKTKRVDEDERTHHFVLLVWLENQGGGGFEFYLRYVVELEFVDARDAFLF